MNLDKERKRLSQAETLKDLQWDLESTSMIPVFQRPNPGSQDLYLSNALIPADKLKFPLSDNDLDLDLDLIGLPIVQSDEDGTRYSRMGAARLDERVKPLIIKPAFNRRKENSLEICEEFRLFNNLYRDEETNKYLKDNLVDGGYEEVVVAIVEPNCVKMLGKEIRQFLKHKEMYLFVRLICRAYSEYSLEELGLRQDQVESAEIDLPDGHLSWRCTYSETRKDGYQTESVLCATRLIGFSKVGEEKPVEFIIGVDKNGNKTTLSCNGGLEAWVYFRKRVLDKYYREHDRYTVEDTFLVCHGSNGASEWILLIDDDHDDKVCAKLSDFALIPYEEQKHWREHNIPPKGNISSTYLKRYGERLSGFTRIFSHGGGPRVSSTRPEHLFRQRYNELQAVCDTYLGWQLVRPFGTVTSANRYIVLGTPLIIRYSGPDEHHLRCLRVPLSDNQVDFDEMVRSLVLVLIDSLNVDNLKAFFPLNQQKKFRDEHTIAWLKAVLNHFGVEGAENHICFLKQLQNLRSSGVGHRKDSDPQMYADSVEYFNLAKLGLQKGFTEILRQAIKVLEFFIHIVRRGELSGKTEVSLLYDLNERLGALFETLFPSESEDVFTDETWMRETVPGIEELANHLMTKVVPKFDGSPSELRSACEPPITSLKPDATTADVRRAITDIAKVFIRRAPSQLQYAVGNLSWAEGTSMPTTVFEKTASRVTYAKKLVDFSLGFVNHDEVADSAWYRHYVAHLLSYVSCYTVYTYTHVLRDDGLDSTSVISDLVSVVQRATDVAEKIAGDDAKNHLLEVKKAAKDLAQAVSHK